MSKRSFNLPGWSKKLLKPSRIKAIFGGRGGGKSWGVAAILLGLSMENKYLILCTREIQKSINDSVKRLLEKLINKFGWRQYFRIQRERIICKVTGSEFIFVGLQDADKIKSYEGVNFCWVEEAQTVSLKSIELLEPTIREPNSEIWYTFNPRRIDDPVYDRHVKNCREGNLIIKVNYWDNPWFKFLPLQKEMEWDKKNRPSVYQHKWCGQPVISTEKQIFHGAWRIDKVPEPTKHTVFWHGLDFGFSVDPCSEVRCWFNEPKKILYIDREVRQIEVDADELLWFVRKIETVRSKQDPVDVDPFDKDTVNVLRRLHSRGHPVTFHKPQRVIADSSRPEMIHILRKNGFDVQGAIKGKGSVEDGLAYLKQFDIVVDDALKDVQDEFTFYSYKEDKLTGRVLPQIEDGFDHSIDALRYALEPRMRRERETLKKIAVKGL